MLTCDETIGKLMTKCFEICEEEGLTDHGKVIAHLKNVKEQTTKLACRAATHTLSTAAPNQA